MANDWYSWSTGTSWVDSTTYTFPSWPQPLSIEDDCGQPCVVLRKPEGTVVGRVYLGSPEFNDLEFFGSSSESTKIFMAAIKSAVNDYLKKQHEKMVKQIITDIEVAQKSLDHFNNERSGALYDIVSSIKEFIGNLKLVI